MPNRLADTLQQVYYMLPYYMQATGQQRASNEMPLILWGPGNETFIPATSTTSDIFPGFIVYSR